MKSISILSKAMIKSGKENFLIDGFPRNQDNVAGWKQTMDGKVNVQCVLFFDCDEKVNDSQIYVCNFYSMLLLLFFSSDRSALPDVLNVVKQVDEPMTMKKV